MTAIQRGAGEAANWSETKIEYTDRRPALGAAELADELRAA